MSTNLFERIFANVDDALNTYVVDTVGNVVGFASPLFTSMMIVFVAMWGYLMMFGRVQEPLQDGVFRIIRIGGIMALGLTVGTYMGVVVTFLQQGPEHISAVVSGAGGTSADTLDALFSQVFAVSKAAWEKGGVLDGNFGLYLIALIVLVIGSGLTLFVAFLILLAKLMTTVLLGIGPLFIICLLFKVTQRFFESWIAMVSNFGLLLVLASSVGTLMTSLAQTYIDKLAPNEAAAADAANLGDAAMLCLVFALCILVVRQVPSVAAALGGGIALATQGAFGSAMNALRPSSMQRASRQVQREYRATKQAVTAPVRAGQRVASAYQKRFGSGNSVASM
ncbi:MULTISPECIES: type IV secretion system protein [Gammaproteobacteria]|jgi:type IV secretion system protein VirB6|uniref:Type IV secretion system protein VirB6 n=3 Tax=Gammaproteobacteria TaxID=1236 RepID=A0A899NFV4_ECOLX|nr:MULTISPECIES: type IV secretion system protein [Gammaproteobacteria]AMQ11314.1 virB6 protein [uncultured bacterium]EAB7901796.1 type IV secretion system protein [Salmonella enterica subsp. enterica serovar Kentucky]EAM3520536.1 type IV secretion system protein [Salmonella enterica]EBR0369992.1 type IV secretion protein [Salmonella enterica subsp. enterica serovar Enteritidis]EBZ2277222.1 type IV secretion system protein [Salmonella enterica subsp. enterica serovar Uganda]ECD1565066.1 type 